MELKMSNVLDSLCRCFGSPVQAGDIDHYDVLQSPHTVPVTPAPVLTTPDAKRRTKNMKLQEEQWDALFDCNVGGSGTGRCGSMSSRHVSPTGKSLATRHKEDVTMEQAQAVAKAKLAANGDSSSTAGTAIPHKTCAKSPQQQQPKRKRATPEDIFRSKKNIAPNVTDSNTGAARPRDAFSRFLSNNPVIANSLCFATPVRDSRDEEVIPDNQSIVSETNTLNTAEDTITSTLYYEQVKLAGLQQKSPPMPLFGAFEVKDCDDIGKIATSGSYSSAKMRDWMLQNPEMLQVDPVKSTSPDSKPTFGNNKKPANSDDIPPDVVNISSDSTGRSV